MSSLVISFGCPRSGTTYLHNAIKKIEGIQAIKMKEFFKLHPCRNDMGLVWLSQLFSTCNITFVRIHRNPMDIVESFVATRKEVHIRGTLYKNDDEAIVDWVLREHHNFYYQLEFKKTAQQGWQKYPWRVINLRYEDLGKREKVIQFGSQLAKLAGLDNVNPMVDYILDSFGNPNKSAIAGRLSSHVKKSVLSADQKKFFVSRLKDVAEKEGYKI